MKDDQNSQIENNKVPFHLATYGGRENDTIQDFSPKKSRKKKSVCVFSPKGDDESGNIPLEQKRIGCRFQDIVFSQSR